MARSFLSFLLWGLLQIYISSLSQGKLVGRYNSYFLAIFYTCDIVGPIVTGVLFGGDQSPGRTTLVIASLATIGFAASAMMWFVPKVETVADTATSIDDLGPRLKRMLQICRDKRMMYLHPYNIYYAVGLAWGWGWLPTLVPLVHVPWYLVCYGIGVYLAAWQSGPLFDRYGWAPLLGSNVLFATVGYIIAPLAQRVLWPLAVSFFCFGVVEAIGTNLIQSTIMKNFEQRSIGDALGLYRFVNGLATGVTMLCGLSYAPLLLICVLLLAVSAPIFAYSEIKDEEAKESHKAREEVSQQIDKARVNVDAAISSAQMDVALPRASSAAAAQDGLYG